MNELYWIERLDAVNVTSCFTVYAPFTPSKSG